MATSLTDFILAVKTSNYGEYFSVPEYALLFGPGGIAAARDYAEEHALEVSEPRLEPEAFARRDTVTRPCVGFSHHG